MRRRIFITVLLTVSILVTGIATACNNPTGTSTATDNTNTSPTNAISTKTTTTTLDVPPAYPQVPQITAPELKKMMDDGTGVIVVDVRDPTSYTYYHIPTAVNFYYDVSGDPMDMTMRLWTLPSDKTIVFYCNCPDDNASGRVALDLIEMGGYPYVRDLKHGLAAWEAEDYPIVTGSTVDDFVTTTLPLQ